jgi:hypothetical protein
MPHLREYNLFISHPWIKNNEYSRLESMLDNCLYFKYKDYSVPSTSPLDVRTDRELEEALERQIRPCSVVIILAGMYVNHRKWIQKEIEIAKKYNKPIIGLIPWGQERTPLEVELASKEMVRWDTGSIVTSIRKHSL